MISLYKYLSILENLDVHFSLYFGVIHPLCVLDCQFALYSSKFWIESTNFF